jgi:hypothetical protein
VKIKEEKITFCLRITSKKYKIVRKLAKNRRRSINKFLNFIIDCHIDDEIERKKEKGML